MEAPDTIIYSSFKLFTIYLEAVNLFTFVLDFYCQGLKKKKVQGAVKEIREALGVRVLIGCLAKVPAPDWELGKPGHVACSHLFLHQPSFWKTAVLFCSQIRKWNRWSWEFSLFIILHGLFCRNLELISKFLFWVWFNILICMPSVGVCRLYCWQGNEGKLVSHLGSCYQSSSSGFDCGGLGGGGRLQVSWPLCEKGLVFRSAGWNTAEIMPSGQ